MSDKQVAHMPIQASSVKKGTYCILKGRPCKVAEVKTSKTGKHGHAKANITGVCVLTAQKCNEVHPASHALVEFKLQKIDYLVTSVESYEGAWKILALDDSNEEVFFFSNPSNEDCKGAELAAAVQANTDKSFSVCVIRAPVEIGDNDFRDEELIESFREDKA
jgi:translation initiation factor 5A